MIAFLLILQENIFMIVMCISILLAIYLFMKTRSEVGYALSYLVFACGVLGYTSAGARLSYALTDTYSVARLAGWLGGPVCIVMIIRQVSKYGDISLSLNWLIQIITWVLMPIGVLYFFLFLHTPDYITPVMYPQITEGFHGAVLDSLQSIILVILLWSGIRLFQEMLVSDNEAERIRHELSIMVFWLGVIYFTLQMISAWLFVYDVELLTTLFFGLKIGTQILTGLMIPIVFVSRRWLYRVSTPSRYFRQMQAYYAIRQEAKYLGVPIPRLYEVILRPAYHHHVIKVAILDQHRGQDHLRINI